MRGIDRRLGLLFCGFLLIFSFAFARSFWLQGVQGRHPPRRGAQPAGHPGDDPG